jgi:hypothetical protein
VSQGVGDLDAFTVTRATLAYNQTQDRISLTCAFKSDECVVLWLTARIARQLVPHLCQAVTQVPDTHTTNGDPAVIDQDAPTSAEAPDCDKTPVAGSAQEPVPEAPVVAGADSATWVVTAIDLTNGPMLVQLGFRDDQGHAPVLLSLEHTQLAEWSEGLKHCYAQAGWPMDCWHMPASAISQSHATRRVALH